MATHAHREGHLVFHLQGQNPKFCVSGKTWEVNNDVALAINPLQPHNVSYVETESPSLLLILYINPMWFLEVGRSADGTLRFGTEPIEMSPSVHRLVQTTANLLIDGDHLELFDGYLCELTQACYDLSWQWSPGQKAGRNSWAGVRDRRVRKSMMLMKEGVGDALVLDEIASQAGLSRPHFYKLFRENVGITPNVYLNTLRMEMAIDRLVRTEEAVTAIGLDLGFASQASFTRFFGANVGIPPSDYRRVAHTS